MNSLWILIYWFFCLFVFVFFEVGFHVACCFKTHLGSWGWPWTPNALVSTSESGGIVGMHSHIGCMVTLEVCAIPIVLKFDMVWEYYPNTWSFFQEMQWILMEVATSLKDRPCVFCFLMLGMEPRVSDMQSKHSTNWILSPARVINLVMKTCVRLGFSWNILTVYAYIVIYIQWLYIVVNSPI